MNRATKPTIFSPTYVGFSPNIIREKARFSTPGKLVLEVCRSEQSFARKFDFREKFAKILVSHVTIREKAM